MALHQLVVVLTALRAGVAWLVDARIGLVLHLAQRVVHLAAVLHVGDEVRSGPALRGEGPHHVAIRTGDVQALALRLASTRLTQQHQVQVRHQPAQRSC